MREHVFKRIVNVTLTDKLPDDLLSCCFRLSLAEHEDHLMRFIWRQFDRDLQGSAGIESGAIAAREIYPPQRGGTSERAVATNEFLAITSRAGNAFVGGAESNALSEFVIEKISRKDRRLRLVDLGEDVGRRGGALHAKHQ